MSGLSEAIDATFIVDDHGVIVDANAAAVEMVGRAAHELVGGPIANVVHGAELESAQGEVDRADASVTAASGALPVHAWRRRVGPDRCALILRDATEWRSTQGMLAMIVAAVEQGTDAVEITDGEGRTEYANPALERALGRRPFDILGEPMTRFLEDDDAAKVGAALARGEPFHGEVVCRHASGEKRHHEIVVTPVVDLLTGERRFVIFRRDATARVLAERQVELLREHVARADRLSVLGHLAASVAHDVNNPATFILANLRLAIDELNAMRSENTATGAKSERLSQVMEMLRDAVDGTERVVALVREMRKLSTRAPPEREHVDLAGVARDALRLTRVHTRVKARLVEQLAPARVIGDRVRLGQVMVNLLMNAAHAIPEGDSAAHCITLTTRVVDDFAEVSVVDSGTSMSPAERDSIFETWFTSKSRDDGPALGLAISHQIVADLGGTLTAEPVGDGVAGNVFTIRFPRASS